MAEETKTIVCSAVIVHPELFTFAAPTTTTLSVLDKNQTAFDLKLKHICDHRLLTGTYKLINCPRCLSTGYYYDIKFGDTGQLLIISLEDKLMQVLEKLAITEENKFHPEIVMGVQKWLGALGNNENLGIIKDEIISTLTSLQEIQKNVGNLSPRTRILTINSITVDLTTPDTLLYNITLTTVSGEDKVVSGTITLSDLRTKL